MNQADNPRGSQTRFSRNFFKWKMKVILPRSVNLLTGSIIWWQSWETGKWGSVLTLRIRIEQYPIPTEEKIITSFPKEHCSVFDTKSGCLPITLDCESILLTTFNTPRARHQWLRPSFGLKSAPEIYQRIIDNMLEGIGGAKEIIDGILIGGKWRRTWQKHWCGCTERNRVSDHEKGGQVCRSW